ncbi:helix-turn-helix domain-containing protein [Aromatoleum buckelii]|uniref:Helix-turn-helix transcriptional regulator n=1 Tax=Aromatoleum buckelii TaxID=200254 RepID=A0ABX1N4Y1_9RHOO|nr:helix-turn-helix transcriptional regulator [Aromatoleum buckelii]MCK0509704.1 helix-turn-helix transcriptional regulator [Aromatoleum buckelii]
MTNDATLESARERYARRAWADAFRRFTLADRERALEVKDLERLAVTAYLVGDDDVYFAALERAYHACVEADEAARAARCGFWLGLHLMLKGEAGHATGWFARAHRLLEHAEGERVEHGYLLLPVAEQQIATAAYATAESTAAHAAAIGERFRDADLVACARHVQGRALLLNRQVRRGLALLDEAMVAVAARELSPIMTGLIYCSVIDACQQMYAVDRAREWTSALARWCDEQPEMIAFTGVCRVHRAEIMRLHGAWSDALDEARQACERCRQTNRQAAAAALYEEAEVHRLRGEFTAAEAAYRNASLWGLEPQPGLALLRLAQGRTDAAAAAIRRALVASAGDEVQRSRLLPAYVEIMLAVGDTVEARRACGELEALAGRFEADVVRGLAAQARGEVELAEGDAQSALASLRDAAHAWERIDAPYLTARVRMLQGLACRALGDEDGAALELEAAYASFQALGAAPDLAGIDALARYAPHAPQLTPRELQVLRLVSAGKSNKAIAAELSLSEKTVDRHLNNIFMKLDVSSRTAATAYAYRHRLFTPV